MGSAIDKLRKKVYSDNKTSTSTTKAKSSAVERLKDIVYNDAPFTVKPENSYANRQKNKSKVSADLSGEAWTRAAKSQTKVPDKRKGTFSDAAKGTAKQYGASLGDSLSSLYQAGQGARDRQNSEFAADAKRTLERAKADLEIMLFHVLTHLCLLLPLSLLLFCQVLLQDTAPYAL